MHPEIKAIFIIIISWVFGYLGVELFSWVKKESKVIHKKKNMIFIEKLFWFFVLFCITMFYQYLFLVFIGYLEGLIR